MSKKSLATTNHFDPLMEGEREELTAPVETTHDMYTEDTNCLLYTSPSPRDRTRSRMPSSA